MLPSMRTYYVYILASRSKALYTGVTNDLNRRVWEHKQKTKGHTSKYNITQLVYFEEYGDPMSAIRREKQIKAWRREKRVNLVKSMNPGWKDLSAEWYK